MDKSDKHIEGLFDAAREQGPKRSFSEVEAKFSDSMASGNVPTGKGLDKVITSKFIIIMGTGIVLIGALIFGLNMDRSTAESETRTSIQIEERKEKKKPAPALTVDTSTEQLGQENESLNLDDRLSPVPELNSMKEADPSQEERFKQTQSASKSVFQVPENKEEEVSTEQEPEVKEIFQIHNKTSREEFEAIKQKAEAVGIDFSYKIKGSKSIKKLKLVVIIDTEDSQSRSSISLDGTFQFSIGWYLDEQGKATEFWNDLDGEELPGLFEKIQEGEGLFQEKED